MSKKVLDAVFFKDSSKPMCPNCLVPLSHTVSDYGVDEDENLYFVSECKTCDKLSKYITDSEMEVIKTEIVERNK